MGIETTSRILLKAAGRVVAVLCSIAALLTPLVFAQHHDTAARAGSQSLTFARHVDTVFTAATAQTAMTNASTVIQTCDGTPAADEDVACQVTMQVSGGAVGTFGAAGDGGDIITSNAEMNALINSGTADVMVVTAIMFCGGPPGPGLTIIGCGNVGALGIVSVNTLPGNMLGVEISHEFLHNQGHEHRGCQNAACTAAGMAGTQSCNCCTGAGTGTCSEGPMTAGAILNPILNLNSNIINVAECGSFHTGASYTAADNGPIVDPPPVITCPADGTAECTSPAGTPKGNAQVAAFLAGATATDGCEPAPTLTNNAPAVFPKGTTAVTFTATDADFLGASSTCQANLQVVDTTAPSITCPAAITVECSQDGGTPATDPAIAAFLAGASATDICDASPNLSNNAPAFFALGTTSVTFSATDDDGNVGSCSADVRVVDTTPPVVVASLGRNVLWPPNHKMVNVGLSAGISDTCDPNPAVGVMVFGDEDDEERRGDGHFSPDAINLALNTLLLREERNGTSDGRVYLVVVSATDASGNVGFDCGTVVVPHDRQAASIALVKGQAAAAKAFCLAHQGAAPPGYFVIGDGPGVGPKR